MNAPCPHCGVEYQFDERFFGHPIACGGCGDKFSLPTRAEYSRRMCLRVTVGAVVVGLLAGGFLYLYLKMVNTPESGGPVANHIATPTADTAKSGLAETDEQQAARKLERAKRLLAEGQRPPARELLNDIVKNHPQTRSAREARELLDETA